MLMTTLDGIEFASAYPDLLGKRVLITGIDNAQEGSQQVQAVGAGGQVVHASGV